MANQKISTLPAATPPVGSELMELVQGGVNSKITVDAVLQHTIVKHVAVNPGPGTFTDNVLPGVYDYILDYDTSAGNIELDGFVGQRDGQRVTIRCTGSGNQLSVGGIGKGSAGNQVSASSAIAAVYLPGDGGSFLYSAALTMWVQS